MAFKRIGATIASEDWRVFLIGKLGQRKVYVKVGQNALALGVERFLELAVGNVEEADLKDVERRAKVLAKNVRHSKRMRKLWKDAKYRRRFLRKKREKKSEA